MIIHCLGNVAIVSYKNQSTIFDLDTVSLSKLMGDMEKLFNCPVMVHYYPLA